MPAGESVICDALISPCGLYRYWLTRQWSHSAYLCFVMLNPSKADATQDDPTIRRCIGFARRDGFGGVRVVNLYAYRATDPADLKRANWPVGPDNDRHIKECCYGETVVAAWGAGTPPARTAAVVALLRSVAIYCGLYCLGKCNGGAPRHPLFVRGDTKLVQFP